MSVKIGVEELASTVLEELVKYNKLASKDVKDAVTKSAKQVKDQIRQTAPRSHMSGSGTYANSWTTKKTHEDTNSLEITVYSPTQYQLAHLLEHGHATRNGGRTRAQPHIAPAEQAGIETFEKLIEEALSNDG